MKQLVIACALMCALSTPILAGEMPTGGKSEQPPPPAMASTSSTVLVSVILTVFSLR